MMLCIGNQLKSMGEQQGDTQVSIVTTQITSNNDAKDPKSFLHVYRVPLILILFGFYFLAFGITELITNYSQTFYSTLLSCSDFQCSGQTGFISFNTASKIYFYLSNPNIAQNDISLDLDQIQDSLASCSSFSTNQQGQKIKGINSQTLIQTDKQFPCGKFVSYFPGDSFSVIYKSNGTQLLVQTSNLDVLAKSYTSSSTQTAWADINSDRFKVWNQKQTAIGMKKLWGYSQNFSSGNLQISIVSQNKIHDELANNLNVIITDNGAFYGYNLQWCIINFFSSSIAFLFGCISCWAQQKQQKLSSQQDERNTFVEINANSPTILEFPTNY